MNMKIYFKIAVITLVLGLSSWSCNDFLDQMPDNRTTISTADQISKLLVSAYPTCNISVLAELSSDNFVDNNSPEVSIGNNLASFERMHDEIFTWDPVSSPSDDSPFTVWEQCYKAIATANQALQSIEDIEAGDSLIDLSAQRGEALMCRAYGHFILVNMFCQAFKDYETSKNDFGIPYMTEPETTVTVTYDRGTVSDVYQKIKADIEAGIGLIDDGNYSIPKYHFNESAAHAFAARFYLYTRDYEKVVEHAGKVLGSNPESILRDWTTIYNNSDEETYAYIDESEPANLLLLPTYSVFFRTFISTRYAFNGTARAALAGGGPAWSGWPPCFSSGWWWTYDQEFGAFCSKVGEMFEYTDKIAGIGFAHIVRTEFTTDETLLCRAEALLFLNRKAEALEDLNRWCRSHRITLPLTEDGINSFYTSNRTWVVKTLNASKMSTSFVVSDEQAPIVQCILHFRRIETIFEGLRWFDIKRYGLEVTHYIGGSEKDVLKWNDQRKAIQIPQDVIAAGLEPNPGKTVSTSNSEIQPMPR